MIYIIGGGGVGSWLAPTLCRLEGPESVTIIDGDTLEKKNLDRQLFTSNHLGRNKAQALAELYGCNYIPEWYSETLMSHAPSDWLIGAVDNNPARLSILKSCDMCDCSSLFAANEVHSSEAFVYLSQWRGSHLDPREFYPEMSSDQSNDPRRAAIGCTGEAQRANRQLVTANFMAAALVSHLYVVWAQESRKMDREALTFLPHKLVNNLTKNITYKTGELPAQKQHGN